MKTIKNIFACLVHEEEHCIVNLVRNLKYLDPASTIILYNGGNDKTLLKQFPFERYDVFIHPNPKRLHWGWLHDFALDCVRFALEQSIDFDTITIVDSDQLGTQKGYSKYITPIICNNSNIGMLATVAERQTVHTNIPPAQTAYQEKYLWQSYLKKLSGRDDTFLYWTFWPSTVITYRAAKDLLHLFDTDKELQTILQKTKIWASEEIILPTLIKALGYDIVKNPCNDTYVQYKKEYSQSDINHALLLEDVYWIHPVLRKPDDWTRKYIAKHLNHYNRYHPTRLSSAKNKKKEIIWNQVDKIEGWFNQAETYTLIKHLDQLFHQKECPIIVETGSYCGRITATIGLVAQFSKVKSLDLHCIDTFDGLLGAADTGFEQRPPSLSKFKNTIKDLGIQSYITIHQSKVADVEWQKTIDCLFIDDLHDYLNVSKDFYHFEKYLADNALIFFHDYADYFPGVQSFVGTLLFSSQYEIIEQVESLILLKKKIVPQIYDTIDRIYDKMPLVSCIMPTYNRREYIEQSIKFFLAQDYPNKELIIIDDGTDSIQDLVPTNDNIRYIQLPYRISLGEKRNKACEMSNGEIIVHWDDDDWYAPNWISSQVKVLNMTQTDITGLTTMYFYDEIKDKAWRYDYPKSAKKWVYGATLAYRKTHWKANKFHDITVGEDNQFIWQTHHQKISINPNTKLYLGRIHNNTSPKQTTNHYWKEIKLTNIDKHKLYT